ncbi:MAG TPA: serine/threonine-protein kinase [Polyangium sp.]|nr:serine/threonine-protein kinase [Polyangium sp.]
MSAALAYTKTASTLTAVSPSSEVPSSRRKPKASRRLPCRLGPYMLFERIGYGGMANIYLARRRTDPGAGKLFVIKEILPDLATNARAVEMLVEEARISMCFEHPNVVRVEDLGRDGDDYHIAMEYVEGLDMRDLLRRAALQRVPIPIAHSLYLIASVLRGLDHAHRCRDEQGNLLQVIHRDVSPANILLGFDGGVKVCDFGIARAGTNLRGDDAYQGKAGYMSPEQAHGELLDARSDVYAVGIMLWELCAGRRLYKAKAGESLLEIARRAEVPTLPLRGCPAEEQLHAIVYKALTPRREDRYASAWAMLRDLERYAYHAKLLTSPREFGTFLHDHFAAEFMPARKRNKRIVEAIESGPVAVLTPIALPIRHVLQSAEIAQPDSNPQPVSSKVPASGVRRKKRIDAPRPLTRPNESGEGGILGQMMLFAAAVVMCLVFFAVSGPSF